MATIFGLIFGGMMMVTMLAILAGLYVLTVIPLMKMFIKAGEDGWKAFIPAYNMYIYIKISWDTSVFWIMLAIVLINRVISAIFGDESLFASIVTFILGIITIVYQARLCAKTSKAFGHGTGYAVGLFFLPLIFYYIIGFGSSLYIGKEEY